MTTSTIIRDIRCAVEASRGDPGFFPTSEMVLRLAAELESVAAERDRLQRACDEGLPREVIPCPSCKVPHVEGPRHDDPAKDGRTRPHHTHRCYGCGHVWESGRWSFGVAPGDENEVTRRLRAEGRAAGLREALDACSSVKGRLLDKAMNGGGPVACSEAFGEEDPLDADGGECELIAAGASLCAEAVEALLTKGGGA